MPNGSVKTLFRCGYLLNITVGTVFNLIQIEIQFLSSSPRKQSSPQPSTGKERSTITMFVFTADSVFFKHNASVPGPYIIGLDPDPSVIGMDPDLSIIKQK